MSFVITGMEATAESAVYERQQRKLENSLACFSSSAEVPRVSILLFPTFRVFLYLLLVVKAFSVIRGRSGRNEAPSCGETTVR